MNATQGFRFGLKKNERLPLGDPVVEQKRMENNLKDEEKMDDKNEYVDAIAEFVEAASNAIHEAAEQGKLDLGDDTVVVPDAEKTYQFKKKQKGKKEENISMRQFWRYRTYHRDELKDDGSKIPNSFHWLWTMQKLSEYFIINVLNRCSYKNFPRDYKTL